MAIDPARLYTALLNTGLQQKDNALYQVIHNLIDQIVTLSANQNASATTTVAPTTVDMSVVMARVILDD